MTGPLGPALKISTPMEVAARAADVPEGVNSDSRTGRACAREAMRARMVEKCILADL